MLKIDSDGIIHLTRGDTARLGIKIHNDASGEDYVMQTGDTLYFTVKASVQKEAIVIEKISRGSPSIHIAPEDTKDVSYGKYVYDVQLVTADGDVYTVVAPTTFDLMGEVTWK